MGVWVNEDEGRYGVKGKGMGIWGVWVNEDEGRGW